MHGVDRVTEQMIRSVLELLDQHVAFMPPTTWEGKTVARFAFLDPHTPMDLVVAVLDGMA